MATVVNPSSSITASPYSFSRFICSPWLPQNPFFQITLKPRPPPPPRPPLPSRLYSATPTPLFGNSNFQYGLHFSFSPTQTQFLPSPQSSVSDSQPLFLTGPFSNRDVPEEADSYVDRLFSLLRLSARWNDAELARAVHASILKLEEDIYLANALIAAYLKQGLYSDAYEVFRHISYPNVVSFTSLISGFSKSSREGEALELFFRMRDSCIEPNEYSFVAILTACIRIMHLQLGLQIHAMVIKMGYLDSAFVANALMALYNKCGCYEVVLNLFDEIPQRDIASWNTVISSAVKNLMYGTAFQLFREMQANDALRLDYFTLSTLLTSSAGSVAVMEGQQVHAHAVKIGLDTDLSVSNSLIGFYAKCGTLDNVESLFERMPVRDFITWTQMITVYMEFGLVSSALKIFDEMPQKTSDSYNALLSGYCQNGECSKALNLFIKMAEEGKGLTDFSLTSVINACSMLMDHRVSEQIHSFVLKFGFGSNICIEAALLEMCTKCARMEDAKKMFCRWQSEEGNYIAWTSMLCGYARDGKLDEAISLVHLSQLGGKVVMDEVASTSVLSLCGTIGFHEMGKQIHSHVLKFGFLSDLGVGNALVSMYFKCWNADDAVKVFTNMPITDIVSWNALIAGYVLHRQGNKALEIWSNMQKKGIKPDKITFVLIISAYRQTNLNLVNDCRSLFYSMRTLYGIEPTSEHYASFIRVLGYWGLLKEAEETINKMPFEPATSVWRALLDSCRLHNNTVIGKRVTKHILTLEPSDPSTYILVSNLYSAYGLWHNSETVRQNMREKGFRKHPAQSWIICQNKIHSFYARDRSHPQAKDIYSGLEILIMECLKAGYVPDTRFVLHEVEEYQKKDFLYYHSSKLAATYGILTTKPGKPIRIVKNILLCGDCHTFLKYVSVVSNRDILLRDSSGFHCFSNGQCSCGDYW